MASYRDYNKFYIDMLERAVIGIGNTFRMKKAIQKAKNGDKVRIVYLGASITKTWRGDSVDGYVALSCQAFREQFAAGENITYVNSGMNGTSSVIGLVRLERDVISLKPDIVFLDFAVNDLKDGIHREMYESLVYRILNSETEPAVVLLFMVAETGYSCQGHMQVIGEHYQLPMISVGDAIWPEIEVGRMTWRDYSDDNIHPHVEGHRKIADMIDYYFWKVDSCPEDKNIAITTSPFFGTSFASMKMLDSRNIPIISLGGFRKGKTLKEFEYGWIHGTDSGNESFKLKLTCKSLVILYMEDNNHDIGTALIEVDGRQTCSLSGYRLFAWYNPAARLLFQEQEAMEHSIEIRMAAGDEEKEFHLLAFGYCL